MNIGERIKQLRTDKNLTQPQLAELANIEQSYLSKLENDKSIPSSEILIGLLKALDVDISTFLKGIDQNVIQRSLIQIPEIAVHLNIESHLRVRQVKRWLFMSALCCAVGLALVFGGLNQLLFVPVNETIYQYVSDGVISQSEPEDLYDRWEFDVTARAMGGEALPTPEIRIAIQAAKDEFRKRLNVDRQETREFKGRMYKVTASEGYRTYHLKEERSSTNLTSLRANSWLAVFGAFLGFGGLFGFFVEFRLRKL
jgi:transcriptional regulator with XRE-family HTH domain